MDLSKQHTLVSDLLHQEKALWQYKLSAEQVEFFHTFGYLKNVPVLSQEQVQKLRNDLEPLTVPKHAGFEFWYEYNSNESKNPDTVLFHALGAWRISKYFHDVLWHPGFTVPCAQLLHSSVRFWHDQLFCKRMFHLVNVYYFSCKTWFSCCLASRL